MNPTNPATNPRFRIRSENFLTAGPNHSPAHDAVSPPEEADDPTTVKSLEQCQRALLPRFRDEPFWLAHRRILLNLVFYVENVRRRGFFKSTKNVDAFILSKLVSMVGGDGVQYAPYVGDHPAYEDVFSRCSSVSNPSLLFVENQLLQKHFHEFLRELETLDSELDSTVSKPLKTRFIRPMRKLETFVRENVIFSEDPHRYHVPVAANINKQSRGLSLAAALPTELLTLILLCLPKPDVVPAALSFSLVSKAWSTVGVMFLYEEPNLSSNLAAYNFFVGLQINSHFDQSRTLGWRDLRSHVSSITMPPRFSLFCAQLLPSLHTLSLQNVDDFEILQPLIYHPPRTLRQLKLHFTVTNFFTNIDRTRWDVPKITAFFSQLTVIHWRFHEPKSRFLSLMGSGPNVLDPLVECGHSNLEAIKLPGLIKHSFSWDQQLFSRCGPALTAVDLDSISDINVRLLDTLSHSCPNVRALCINADNIPNDEVQRYLKQQGHKLEYLHITTPNNNDDFWIQMSEHCTSLRYLICKVGSALYGFKHFRGFIEQRGSRLEGFGCRLTSTMNMYPKGRSEIYGVVADHCVALRYVTFSLLGYGSSRAFGQMDIAKCAESLRAVLEKCSSLRAFHVDREYLRLSDSRLAAKGVLVGTVETSRSSWEDDIWSSFFERHS
ncbi:hypothetical protein HK102_014037 [Quaeritorhiza haematococci]|nr:hypothetical protein HK102_014037 [Quaeritorhiza haematococci]